MEYTKVIVINFDEKGTFESATRMVAGVVDPENGLIIPQPNVPVDIEEIRKLLG